MEKLVENNGASGVVAMAAVEDSLAAVEEFWANQGYFLEMDGVFCLGSP